MAYGTGFTSYSMVEDLTLVKQNGIWLVDSVNVCTGQVAGGEILTLEAPIGGVVTPTNKLEVLTPYIALAGLVVAVSVVVAVKKRRD